MSCFKYFVFLLIAATDLTGGTRNDGKAPWVELNDHRRMPTFGFGTWLGLDPKGNGVEIVQSQGNEVDLPVEWAIDAGYRLIDTAFSYNTEDQVGRAIKKKIEEKVVKREELFVSTKLWNDRHAASAVVPALNESLEKLGLDYVDLFLIHFPVGLYANGSYDNTDYLETWEGMVQAKALGLAKSIGVCNFNQRMMERLLVSTSVKPAVLQIEVNLNLQQPCLLSLCKKHGIAVMAYTPFGALFASKTSPASTTSQTSNEEPPPPRADDPALVAMATTRNKTVPQIVLKYLVDLEVIPIPKSVKKTRIEENIDILDIKLTPAEKQTLKAYDKNYKTISVKQWSDSPLYPFHPEDSRCR